MRRKPSKTLLTKLLLAALFFLAACGQSGPVEMAIGEHRCEFCRMDIVDLRFKAEAISSKGKAHYFDSVECLTRWMKENPKQVSKAWVGSYSQPFSWIAWDQAFFLQSDKIHSPMGGHLAAFASESDAKKALREYGGEILNAPELQKKLESKSQSSHSLP